MLVSTPFVKDTMRDLAAWPGFQPKRNSMLSFCVSYVYLQVSKAVVDRILKECQEGKFVNYYACTNHFKEVRARPGAESFFVFYEGEEKYQKDPLYTMGAADVHTDLYGKNILSKLCSFL